jgi:hypothetical protein
MLEHLWDCLMQNVQIGGPPPRKGCTGRSLTWLVIISRLTYPRSMDMPSSTSTLVSMVLEFSMDSTPSEPTWQQGSRKQRLLTLLLEVMADSMLSGTTLAAHSRTATRMQVCSSQHSAAGTCSCMRTLRGQQ